MNKFNQKTLKNSQTNKENLVSEEKAVSTIIENLEIINSDESKTPIEAKSIFDFSIEDTFNFRKKIEKLENNLMAYKSSLTIYNLKLDKVTEYINKRDNISMDDDLDNLRIKLILKDDDDRHLSEEARAIKEPYVLQKFIEAVVQFLSFKIKETEEEILTQTNKFINK